MQSRRVTLTNPRRTAGPLGFTLVELLVVITIIGILMMLLLPAVSGVQDVARRTKCKNNLRNLGQACQTHEEQVKFYPSGGWGWWWVGDPDREFGKSQPSGWLYNILPYIEQQNLHDMGRGQSTAIKRQCANRLTKTPLELVNCPSRRKPITYPNVWSGTSVANNADNNTSSDNVSARADYAANCGDQGWNEYWGGPGTLAEGDNPATWTRSQTSCSGVSFERSEIPHAKVSDGTSNTIMLGEKYMSPDKYASGDTADDNESMYTGFDNDNFRTTSIPPQQDRRGVECQQFGSAHSVAAHFAMCDGSVRSLSYTVDAATYKCLGNRADGIPIDVTKLER